MKPTWSKNFSRRDFLATASAATAFSFTFLPSRVWGANERLRFAGIGVGGKGSSDIDQASTLGDVVALCDCDDNSINEKLKKWPSAKKFNDFRQMFDKMGKDIDAVTISTPDHTHAIAAAHAITRKMHVYVQKPLTHDVWEARYLRTLARKYKVATQMGNQGSAANGLRRGVEAIQAGVIGTVTEAHVWTNRPVWPQSPAIKARPTEVMPVPANVHWDEFIGTAPMRPYNKAYHPFNWRGWWDYGTGAIGDMACHTANLAFRALNLTSPTLVEAQNEALNPETYPGWASVVYHFPAVGSRPAVKLFWYEGKLPNGEKNLPPKELFHGQTPPGSGSLLVGNKGVMYSPNDYGAQWVLLPEKNFENWQDPAPRLPRNGRDDVGMKEEWVAAIKGGPAAYSNFDFAADMTEAILLGNVAMLAGGRIGWDSKRLKVTDNKAAQKFIKREYRKGWKMPS
ncbi:MAG: Gfo/Idh/MocA family oxidoreductase [Verrucomicrobiales bacterium]|nr:Gfo/Idh/MocA family oxidoreductase [Verrucomicrobiales bacterium]